ncbi:MAG TPA: FAD-dependent oxidoreductase [Chitinophagaceae bacterium]
MSGNKRIAVIGAGPAGLTAAYRLTRQGCAVDVYEASAEVGGMCKTLELWGQRVDLGPHRFFSQDRRINELWLEVVGSDYRLVDRLTRIYYKGKFFQYPLKATDALRKLGALEVLRSMQSYFRTRVSPPHNDNSFEYWVTSRFGKRLFEIFFKSYSEKLWGIPCNELDADFAAQRIKKFSLSEAVKHAFTRSSNRHNTLVSKFAYPIAGTGMVYHKMERAIREKGGNILLNSPIASVSLNEQGAVNGVVRADGSYLPYDEVISSMPLNLLVKQLSTAPASVQDSVSGLRFRNTILVYLHIEGEHLFPDNWLYVQEPSVRMGRITNFRNWVPELYNGSNNTILVLEYWCYDKDDIWTAGDKQLTALATREITKTGLLQNHKILDSFIYRIPRCYPVYHKGYKEALAPVIDYLKGVPGLTCIGRYGAFKYNNQDHSILMGILAAENILHHAGHDLWNVNTDYETYQEKTMIAETGLEM